jgi:lipopolysaccharide biosynthesis regulator YciM
MPSGTPPVAQFSAEDTLIAREQFDDAAAALRRHVAADPANVAAQLRLAAVLNDHLGDRDSAARCYHAVRNSPTGSPHDWVVTNGLIDLYRSAGDRRGLKEELGRLARQFRSTAAGRHARAELARLLREEAADRTQS